jgi:hypothetical protein
MSEVGKQILENLLVVPLGMDPAQMRAQVDVPAPVVPPVAPEKKDDDVAAAEISQSIIRTFQTFYIEKKYEDAAKVIQDAIGTEKATGTVIEALRAEWGKELLEQATKLNFLRGAMPKFSGFITAATDKWSALDEKKYEDAAKVIQDAIGTEKATGTVIEALRAEWGKELLEQATKLNFLRGAMPKFSGFITAATDKWSALDEKEKEAAVEYLKRIGKKMTMDMKGRIEGLTASTDSAEVMMLAMMVYMFGVGISGEGHMKGKEKGEGEGAAASA